MWFGRAVATLAVPVVRDAIVTQVDGPVTAISSQSRRPAEGLVPTEIHYGAFSGKADAQGQPVGSPGEDLQVLR